MAQCEQKANSLLMQELQGKTFPIMGRAGARLGTIPLSVLEPHAKQAERNHGGQTLARLAERGGLAPLEAIAVLTDRCWSEVYDGVMPADTREEAERQLNDQWRELQELVESRQ